jgi:hypothetical protein
MSRYQKIAWFNLIVIAVAIIATSMAIAVEVHIRGYSTIGPWFAGILVLLNFTPRLFKTPQSPGGVVCDERDELILARAAARAWITLWWLFVVLSVLLFLIVGPRASVPTITLPLMALAGGLVHKIACSVAILNQYGWTSKGGLS